MPPLYLKKKSQSITLFFRIEICILKYFICISSFKLKWQEIILFLSTVEVRKGQLYRIDYLIILI